MEEIIDVAKSGYSLRELFGQALVKYGADFDFFVTDADVAGGTGTYHFRDKYSDRFYQIGIAEQSLIGVSAGLAMASNKPVVATTFAMFAQRAFEIFNLSVAYNNANVKLVLSHIQVYLLLVYQ